jgi:pimeloyl-ACP methyl ester carboxylesterase
MLVHGAACNHKLWNRQWSVLSSFGQVLAVDLPGHGASEKLPADQRISVQAYADHIHSALSALKCQSAVLIGHSMGGAISMRYSLDHPKTVKALVLVGTGAKLGVSPAILEGLSTNFEQTVRAGIGGWAFAKTTEKRVIEEGVKEMLKCEQQVALADFRACNEFDIREYVSDIKIPTLIMVGDEDRLTPLKWSEFLHNEISGSKMAIINAAGHMVMLEKYEEVNKRLTSFIRKLT